MFNIYLAFIASVFVPTALITGLSSLGINNGYINLAIKAIAVIWIITYVFKKIKGDSIYDSFIFKIIGRITKLLMKVSILPSQLLIRLPFVSRIISKILEPLNAEKINKTSDWFFYKYTKKSRKASLLTGLMADKARLANTWFPSSKLPQFWKAENDTPNDLKRSLVVDGVLTVDHTKLNHYPVDKSHWALAVKYGVVGAVLIGITWGVLYRPSYIFGYQNHTEKFQITATNNVANKLKSNNYLLNQIDGQKDVWGSSSQTNNISKDKVRSIAEGIVDDAVGSGSYGILSTLLLMILTFLVTIRFTIQSFIKNANSQLSFVIPNHRNKEVVVRNRYRMETNNMEHDSYMKQLRVASTIDKGVPLIKLGDATGVFKYRGSMSSPSSGQEVSMSLNDFHQNMIVFGGTGSGKTRLILTPIIRQLLDIRAIEGAKAIRMKKELNNDEIVSDIPYNISMYLTDGKAVFYHEIKELALKSNQEQDLKVIGCNPLAGEYSVDLLDGISPQMVSDILKSVSSQSGGGGGKDSIWPDMAAEVIRHCGVIARAYQKTMDGLEYTYETNEKPYSLVFIYKLAMDNGVLTNRVADAIYDTFREDFAALGEYANVELLDSLNYITTTWLPMVKETKNGISINITQALGLFSSNTVLRESFGSGGGSNQIKVASFWGSLIVTNISVLEYGAAGRIINVFLKSLFKIEAVKREQRFKLMKSDIEKEFFNKYPDLSFSARDFGLLHQDQYTQFMTEDNIKLLNEIKIKCEDILLQCFALTEGGELFDLESVFQPTDFYQTKVELVFGSILYLVQQGIVKKLPNELENSYKDYLALSQELIDTCKYATQRLFLSEIPKATIEQSIKGNAESIKLYNKWVELSTKLSREKMFFIADEYQTLITVDLKEGALSDSNFWNISRSTGTAGIIATQSVSALNQAIGKDATENFLNNMRSKIFLPVEDKFSIDFIKNISGKTLRFYTTNPFWDESYEATLLKLGIKDSFVDIQVPEVRSINPTRIDNVSKDLKQVLNIMSEDSDVFFKPVNAGNHSNAEDINPMFIRDTRFLLKVGNTQRGGTSIAGVVGAEQAAEWRKEDKYQTYLNEGNHEEDIFHESDYVNMGQKTAYMFIQRSGKSKQDFVTID